MTWLLLGAIGIVVIGLFMAKQASFMPAEAARKQLAAGALVIDVRTREEFAGGHLPEAVNVPLDDLETALPSCAPDKNRVVLLHCLSGGRSAVAASRMKSMGYTHVFNLGSYRRAEIVLGQK
jgi:phage shock protein E